NEVRKLPRLPETADELRAIATQLKAPAASVRLGAAATERAVQEADLARYRNLAFATHGLMAGDFKGLAEPALVLTAPAVGSEIDDANVRRVRKRSVESRSIAAVDARADGTYGQVVFRSPRVVGAVRGGRRGQCRMGGPALSRRSATTCARRWQWQLP